MITALEIENFKGIGTRVRLEIKPITLLFGANSAGKSTIIQALHYARELFEHNNPNPDRTIGGGEAVELGGFRNLAHNHDLSKAIAIRMELDLSRTDLSWPRLGAFWSGGSFDFGSHIQSCWIEITARWNEVLHSPQVNFYEIGINGVSVSKMDSVEGYQAIAYLNTRHPLFSSDFEDSELPHGAAVLDLLPEEAKEGSTRAASVALSTELSILPAWDDILPIKAAKVVDEKEVANLEYELGSILEQVLVGPGRILREELRSMRYLGPLRQVPPRNYEPVLTTDESRWASGLGAWDIMYRSSDAALESLNRWLAGAETLNSGYRVRRMTYKELDVESPLAVALTQNRAFDDFENVAKEIEKLPTRQRILLVEEASGVEILPQDAGVGISQLVPVVVAALEASPELVVIEQPELHVHPAVQVALGDLFISRTKRPDRRFLIETHSEHLILRVLRRIRETADLRVLSEDLQINPDEVAVHYVEQQADGAKITRLRIDASGEFIDRWPKGFFEERGEELF